MRTVFVNRDLPVLLQYGANQAVFHFWDQTIVEQHLLLAAIPAMLFTGLVQEGLKLVPPLVYMRYKRPLSSRDALMLGAVAGAGFGIFEAAWVLNAIFASGFTWAMVQLQGGQALLGFWERFSAVGFHTGATSLAIYGWNRGKGWQFYGLVALLHIMLNYGIVLLYTQVLTVVQLEIYASVFAVAVLGITLWLRWRRQSQESGSEDVSSMPAEVSGE